LSTDVGPKAVNLPFGAHSSIDQVKALQVIFGPAGLGLNYGSQSFDGERVTPGVRCYGNAATVRMFIPLVRSTLAYKLKTVANERGFQFASGDRTKATVVDGHVLNGDRYAGCLLGNLGDFNRVIRPFR
jgi:hypothetical protein